MVRKSRKIAVLGTGNVGATIAYTLTQKGLCSELVLVDINKEKAEGEALDLAQCEVCVPSSTIRSGEYSDVAGADIVIVTFGIPRKADQTRLEVANVNVGIITKVMPTVAQYAPDALYIIVSNPVDVLTYATIKCTGLPASQVIGTGTLLDSNRLAQAIAQYCKVDVKNVNAYVFGEHGDACMVPWSLCTICGLPIKTYCKEIMGIDEATLEAELENIYVGMKKSGSKVIKAKGATFYAIGASTVQLVESLLADSNTILPLSTVLNGEYGAKDMSLGIPCMVNATGLVKPIELPITAEEQALFAEKIAAFEQTYISLGIRD